MNSLTYKLPELTPLEKALPVSKYYTDYPLHNRIHCTASFWMLVQ